MKLVKVTPKFATKLNNVTSRNKKNWTIANNTYAYYAKILQQNNTQKLKICGNTTVNLENQRIVIRLYGHPIIYYTITGFVFLDNRGYKTVTTKQRMNQFSPVEVHQYNFNWYYNDVKERPYSKFVIGFNTNTNTIFHLLRDDIENGELFLT